MAGEASDKWYSEIANYSFVTNSSKNGSPVTHFTAMVWNSTTEVGFGFACGNETLKHLPQYPGKACYVVANYLETPNYKG